MSNLATELQKEIKRNQELRDEYLKIPEGIIGAAMLKTDIDFAIHAMAESNIVNELLAYEKLKKNEG